MNLILYLTFIVLFYIVFILDIFNSRKKMTYPKLEKQDSNDINAFLDGTHSVQIVSKQEIDLSYIEKQLFSLIDHKGKKIEIAEQIFGKNQHFVQLNLAKSLDLSNKHLYEFSLKIKKKTLCKLTPRGILFDNLYSDKMGMNILETNISFTCFAPTAQKVSLLLYKTSENEDFKEIPMTEIKMGLWSTNLSHDSINLFYKYRVYGSDFLNTKYRDVMDPYSYYHQHRFSRSQIIKENTEVIDGPVFPREKSIIYEVHIRDFSISDNSGMINKGKFLAFTEKETSLNNQKTGIAHLKELGVNVIHLLPVQNFDQDDDTEQYDWGYMPLHFYCLHGSYSSNPLNLSRITEFKKLVSSLHKQGFKVVIDIVFNHTAEDLNNPTSFQGLAPGYYYRKTFSGDYFNGSGCGNEFKTEAPMARKFILDYLKFWMSEYKIDGFRFDLMGLMDYETFLSIERELQTIKSDVLLYGEPWVAGDCGIEVTGKGAQKQLQFSVFNDHFRDALRGQNSPDSCGFTQGSGDFQKIWNGIRGGIDDFTHNPAESINYVACHDNYTLSDKLKLSLKQYEYLTQKDLIRCEKLNALLIMTSQGIPFIQAGQEFARSKNFDHNSYQSSDLINQIDWSKKEKNIELFQFYKNLITLRGQHKLLRLSNREQVQEAYTYIESDKISKQLFVFKLKNFNLIDSFESLIFILNPNTQSSQVDWTNNDYKVIIDSKHFHLKTKDAVTPDVTFHLKPFDFIVLAKFNLK
ncbi:MAG: type I pullulanase [Candidatus Cloacimonadota bacterium]|nr:MAG: type I pullulanase [Candidatus Cloacimonadota bacterium]